MMLKGIQILGMLVGLYLLFNTLKNYKKKNYGLQQTIFYVIFWAALTISFYNTELMNMILPILTTQDMVMSVLVLGELAMFVFLSYQTQQISSIEKKITKIVQHIALNDYLKDLEDSSRESND